MANFWDSAPVASPLDAALSLEGITGPQAALAKSIYEQESGSGSNTKTSNAGAVGGMQIIPSTFKSVAEKDWDINDPIHNARAGVRYIGQMLEAGGGDPRLAAIGYYGGPGAIAKAKKGVAVSDPRNPKAPTTFQYGDSVVSRLAKLGDDAAKAILPEAQAGQVPANWWEAAPVAEGEWWKDAPEQAQGEFMPLDQQNIHADQPIQTGPQFDAKSAVNESLKLFPDSPDPMQNTKALGAGLAQGVGEVGLGAEHWLGRGAQAIGADQTGQGLIGDAAQGRAQLGQWADQYTEQAPFAGGVGKLAGNVAATLPVGGVLGKGVQAVSQAPRAMQLANALRSGGTNLGGAAATTAGGTAANLGIRAAGGAATGGAMAGLVNPDDAGAGALIGGAFPVVGQGVASGARALGRSLRGGQIAPEIATLAGRAKQLGIDIPADRIANSKPLNAVASSLEYVPFSGRTATLDKMQGQFNRAISKTFGQDSDNVTMALRKASGDLGNEFDRVLKNNAVKVDAQLTSDLSQAAGRATNELESGQAKIITNQIDEILSKAKGGQIDGQAAYNIKKTLDRIGKRNSPEGFYADELRKTLMDALNRSLGKTEAQKFAKVREQYGNMLTLRRFAQNGVDGDVSIARIANMRDIRSPQLQELADIAAQFLKPREGAHGAAQRVVAGGAAAVLGGPVALGASVGTGRLANALLNSGTAKSAMLGQAPSNPALANALRQFMPVSSKVAPILAAQ